MRLPRALQGHRMDLEPYLGADATGPLYGPKVERRCLAEGRTRSVRQPDGRVVVDGTVIRTDLDHAIGPEWRVTFRGRVVEVLSVVHYDGGGLGTPDHTEITVQ